MPTYEYACKACGQHLEVVQSFKDDALTTCPACDGPLRKVFGSIGIAFKGSGFYRTDSRTASKARAEKPAAEKPAAAAADKAGPDAPAAKPAEGASSSGSGSSGAKEASKTSAASA